MTPWTRRLPAALVLGTGLTGAAVAHAGTNLLHDMAVEFVVDEFVPTLLALAEAAMSEPLTWAVLGALALPALLRRRRRATRPLR
jgi:hypothetical protein